MALGLLSLLGGTERLGIGTVERVRLLVVLNLGLEGLVVGTVLPSSGKLFGGARSAVLPALADMTLLGRGHGG